MSDTHVGERGPEVVLLPAGCVISRPDVESNDHAFIAWLQQVAERRNGGGATPSG